MASSERRLAPDADVGISREGLENESGWEAEKQSEYKPEDTKSEFERVMAKRERVRSLKFIDYPNDEETEQRERQITAHLTSCR